MIRALKFISIVKCLLFAFFGMQFPKISLWNGSDILIATPCAVVRLLKGEGIKPLNLNRLCHLVLDNADILIEQFIDQVS